MFSKFQIKPLEKSKFVKTFSIEFKQAGKCRKWDCAEVFDSVAVLLYHTQKDAILLVRQFRPSVWAYFAKCEVGAQNFQGNFEIDDKEANRLAKNAYTYELCAGLMDKNKSEAQTASEEILEETGFAVEAGALRRVASHFSALGFAAARQTLFYATINDSQRLTQGGGTDDEDISLEFVPRSELLELISDENKVKAPNLSFAILWFLQNFSQLNKEAK